MRLLWQVSVLGVRRATSFGVLCCAASGVWGSPIGVSPGAHQGAWSAPTRCPTFSWSEVAEVTHYELVVYEVQEDLGLLQVLDVRVPGGATTWNPSFDQCLEPNRNYAWTVRGVDKRASGAWSATLFFDTLGVRAEPASVRGASTVDLAASENPLRVESAERYPLLGQQLPSVSKDQVTVGALRASFVAPDSASLNVDGDLELGGFLFKDGWPFMHNIGGEHWGHTAVGHGALLLAETGDPRYFGRRNTAFGQEALHENIAGGNNTAIGWRALASNSSGGSNTASGTTALGGNTTGCCNTANGSGAVASNRRGDQNTGIGWLALFYHDVGDYSTAVGAGAMFNGGGSNSTAVGGLALANNYRGEQQTAVGFRAGYNWTEGENSIALGRGAEGIDGESGVIRIGGQDLQTKAFVEGISQTSVHGVHVLITEDDQLGIRSSSKRFKHDIETVEGLREQILRLRAVSFRYNSEVVGSREASVEYGLIAEEVAEVFPELVVRDREGRPFTVRYGQLSTLLLNELQQQARQLEDYEDTIASLHEACNSQQLHHERRLVNLERAVAELATVKSELHH